MDSETPTLRLRCPLTIDMMENENIGRPRKFSAKITSDQVKYDVVDRYGRLMELVN